MMPPIGTTVEVVREVVTPFHTFAAGSRYVVTGHLDRRPPRVKVRPVGGGQERGIDPRHLREVRP